MGSCMREDPSGLQMRHNGIVCVIAHIASGRVLVAHL